MINKKYHSTDPWYQLYIDEIEHFSNSISSADVKISVIIPIENPEKSLLRECINSVLNQNYRNWEMIIVDNESSTENIRDIYREYNDSRIQMIHRKSNETIICAVNDGIKLANGEFITFLDNSDVLDPHALNEVALKLEKNPDLNFIYSDEDKISLDGEWRAQPFFKPDWSPDTFLSMNYTNHLSVMRTSLVKKLLLRSTYDGAQYYDLAFRLLELIDDSKISHIDKVLYHSRRGYLLTIDDSESNLKILQANKKVKEDALKRRGIKGHTELINHINQYDVIYDLESEPLVSIIIPSKDNVDCLFSCLDSIDSNTNYKNYEIILVDNGSNTENQIRIKEKIKNKNIQYVYEKSDFNFSYMCNIGAKHSKGDFLLFLNDDIEIPKTSASWLTRMVGQALQPHTGAVGAKLLYPGGNSIQHCGVISLPVGPTHALAHQSDDTSHIYQDFGRNILNYNYIAVTGACLLIDRNKFQKIGGFSEKLAVAYNDVDLCFSLYERGYYNIVRNDVCLIHKESVSRGIDIAQPEKLIRMNRELSILANAYPLLVKRDPFYSENLSQYVQNFSIRIEDTKKGKEYNNTHLIKGPTGKMVPNMSIWTYMMIPVKTTIISGWASTGNEDIDKNGEFSLILDCGENRILEVPVITYPSYTTPDVLKGGSGLDGFWFIARFDDHYVWRLRHRIGLSVKYKENRYYCWTDSYITKPKYICHHIHEVPSGTIKTFKSRDMVKNVDRLILEDGSFSVKGWAFYPDENYNFKKSFHIFLEHNNKEYKINVDREMRLDVCRNYPEILNLLYCGYQVNCVVLNDMNLENTNIYLVTEDLVSNEWYKCLISGKR